jgi:2-methylcitrate dehydratase PrpD
MDLSETFAREISALSAADLKDHDVTMLQALLLDYFGVALGGAGKQWVEGTRRWALTRAGSGAARMIGSSQRVPPDVAALVNGVAGHSNELDDTHEASCSHPGCVIIPTALAMASDRTSGLDFLVAVAAGYETIARLGEAADAPDILHRGLHPTSLLGVFGAATTAAKLTGLDLHGLLTAWGHALSLCAGSVQFSDEVTGTAVKRMHAGYAAKSGILASDMARFGVSAPLRSLDGKYGFLKLYGGNTANAAAALAESHDRLAIHGVSLKPYACCRLFHSAIDCLRDLTDTRQLKAEDVEEILIKSSEIIGNQHMMADPLSPMAAQYSLPYSIGATLAYGPAAYGAYEENHLQDPAIRAWSRLVRFEVDARYTEAFPKHFGAFVQFRTKSGDTFSASAEDGSGSPNKPMEFAFGEQKLKQLVAMMPGADLSRLTRAVRSLGTASNLDELQAAFFGDIAKTLAA